MPANSETILTIQQHPGDSTTETITGEKFKGDGYYGRSDGLHTVQYSFDGLTGTINIQATLAIDPTVDDWFTVHTYTAAQETSSKITSFTGNYVWIRAVVEYTDGTINSVALNH
jgi:hypothetical protein